jgi:DNA-binding XRE family transcriptional regulator
MSTTPAPPGQGNGNGRHGETPSTVPRRVLGLHLRSLRQEARLTVKTAASLMEWSEPTMWRIETGQTTVRAIDTEAMCALYSAPPGLT